MFLASESLCGKPQSLLYVASSAKFEHDLPDCSILAIQVKFIQPATITVRRDFDRAAACSKAARRTAINPRARRVT